VERGGVRQAILRCVKHKVDESLVATRIVPGFLVALPIANFDHVCHPVGQGYEVCASRSLWVGFDIVDGSGQTLGSVLVQLLRFLQYLETSRRSDQLQRLYSARINPAVIAIIESACAKERPLPLGSRLQKRTSYSICPTIREQLAPEGRSPSNHEAKVVWITDQG
jgi:hypothetical protein